MASNNCRAEASITAGVYTAPENSVGSRPIGPELGHFARVLFEGRYSLPAAVRGYDVTSDGRRFLMVQPNERPPTVASQMILVQNWVEELKQKVPAGNK